MAKFSAAEKPRTGWRVIRDPALDGIENMARDLALFEQAARPFPFQPTLRFYAWEAPWITIGYFQKRADGKVEGIDPDACARYGVRLAKRPTGGKAVLHGHDLTFSLSCALSELECEATRVKAIYRWLASRIIAGLNEAGIAAALGETLAASKGSDSADCFARVSPNDIVDPTSGSKLIGCALRVSQEAVLMQCSLPIASPLVPPDALFTQAASLEITERKREPIELALERAFVSL